jgi:hypothetical protein
MTILALAGKAGVGKDTMANVLVKKHSFTRVSLADPLRELCSKVFRMDYNMFLDHDKKDSSIDRIMLDYHHIDKIRDIVQNEWGYEITYDMRENMEEYYDEEFETPRDILRCIGTKLLRNCISRDIWIELAMSKIQKIGPRVVITDCRFPNEREAFAKCGALLILIKRNDDGSSEGHEHDLGEEFDYDVVFTNDGELSEFQSNVDMWYTMRKDELSLYKVFKYE